MTDNNFLEQLYYGNIAPIERSINTNTKLSKIMKVVSDEIEKLNSKMSPELQKELDKLLSLKTTEACQMEVDAFVYGCRFVFRLLMSCMNDDNNDFKFEELLKMEGEVK